MVIADAADIPVTVHLEIASSHELNSVQATIDSDVTQYAFNRKFCNKAYDCDGFDMQNLSERGI